MRSSGTQLAPPPEWQRRTRDPLPSLPRALTSLAGEVRSLRDGTRAGLSASVYDADA